MNKYIQVTSEFGIIIRKKALLDKHIDQKSLEATIFLLTSPYSLVIGESDDLMSLGPYPGREFMEMIGKNLTKLGLEYIDDFFYFYGDFPDWAEFSVTLNAKF